MNARLRAAVPGDTLLVGAGTVHAIGPGCFVYEIEQPSDLTFRISDWGRPPTAGRRLHTAEALRAARIDAYAEVAGTGWSLDGGALRVREFALETASLPGTMDRRPEGRSVEVVTAIGARADVVGNGWRESLRPLESLVVPAAVTAYQVTGTDPGHVLVGSIP